MPAKSDQYDGVMEPRYVKTTSDQWDQTHVFAIGDWGAPLPDHKTYRATPGLDEYAQYSVAKAMKNRASWAHPSYVLNVGDNFYLAGIVMDCNAAPNAAWGKAKADFSSGWQSIYAELANIPWLSVLGNHDYGGWQFNNGWPQQIGYSFVNYNWIMPARYYNKKIAHNGYDVEYFMLDTNSFDAKAPTDPDTNHNICSQKHNYGDQCTGNDGMANVWSCQSWFQSSWSAQKAWFEEKLAASNARWKIVVTHFPCGYEGSWYKALREQHGLDLIVTGHRHQQELWWPGTTSKYVRNFMNQNDLGDLVCVVSGGGGGITAQKFMDADYGRDLLWYGFFHLTISKWELKVELVDIDGGVKGNVTIKPRNNAPTTTPTTPTTTPAPTTQPPPPPAAAKPVATTPKEDMPPVAATKDIPPAKAPPAAAAATPATTAAPKTAAPATAKAEEPVGEKAPKKGAGIVENNAKEESEIDKILSGDDASLVHPADAKDTPLMKSQLGSAAPARSELDKADDKETAAPAAPAKTAAEPQVWSN